MYKLIIIDDEYEIRYGLTHYFPWHETGFEVVEFFESPLQALDYIEEYHVDAALCDIKMPKMSGLEFAKELSNSGKDTKIVFLSGYKYFDYLKEAMEYNAFNYLLKPVNHEEMHKTFLGLKEELDKARENLADFPDSDNESIYETKIWLDFPETSTFPPSAQQCSVLEQAKMQ